MRKIFLMIFSIFILTACPSEKDVKEMSDSLFEKKTLAVNAISARDFSLDGLLKVHDYFFDFSEKVHLMKEDPKAKDNIKSMIKKKSMNSFCHDFVVSQRIWKQIDDYCKQADIYQCSLEIKNYADTQKVFLGLLGPEMEKQFKTEKECQ